MSDGMRLAPQVRRRAEATPAKYESVRAAYWSARREPSDYIADITDAEEQYLIGPDGTRLRWSFRRNMAVGVQFDGEEET